MKRIIFFFFGLLFIIGNSYSQPFRPLPTQNGRWIIKEDDGQGGWYILYITDTINPDTIFNSLSYTKIYESGMYNGAYRSDTSGKCFFVHPDSMSENLMFDFSALPGDTLFNVFCVALGSSYPVLD